MKPASGALSSVIEDYVLAVYRFQAAGEPVVGVRLAEGLGVAPPSVTQMLGRLRRDGLICTGRPVVLSDTGLALARTLASRHRLIECFLCDVLGLGWDEVHDEAHRLEHALSARVTERLADLLGHPTTCPHGHPIMEGDAVEPELDLRPLNSVGPGDRAVVRRIAKEDTALLGLLRNLGIGLATRLRVDAVDAAGARLHLDVEGRAEVIDGSAAEAVLVSSP